MGQSGMKNTAEKRIQIKNRFFAGSHALQERHISVIGELETAVDLAESTERAKRFLQDEAVETLSPARVAPSDAYLSLVGASMAAF